jgi:hypothetical protein
MLTENISKKIIVILGLKFCKNFGFSLSELIKRGTRALRIIWLIQQTGPDNISRIINTDK